MVADADANLVGWMYWQWLYYEDPTGSHDSGLWPAGPATSAQLDALSETYAEAIAGTPTSMTFDSSTAAFHLSYLVDRADHSPDCAFRPSVKALPGGLLHQGHWREVDVGGWVLTPSGDQRPVGLHRRRDGHVGGVRLSEAT